MQQLLVVINIVAYGKIGKMAARDAIINQKKKTEPFNLYDQLNISAGNKSELEGFVQIENIRSRYWNEEMYKIFGARI